MRPVDGLCLDGRVPPRVVQHHIAGVGEIQARARRAERQEEHARFRVGLEGIDHFHAPLGLAGQDVGLDPPLTAGGLQELQHLHELGEQQDLVAGSQDGLEQFEKGLGLARNAVVADEPGMAADLTQAGERRQDVHLGLGHTLLLHGLHHLLAAAAQLGQVQLALIVVQLAVAAFLDAVGQVLGHLLLHAAQHDRAQLGAETAALGRTVPFGTVALGLVDLVEVLLVAQVSRLREIHDGPKVEHAVFKRGTGEGQTVIGLDLLHSHRHLGRRVLDELSLVEHQGAEVELAQLFKVSTKDGIVGDHDVGVGDLLAQIVPLLARLEHQHLEVGGELLGLTAPVVQHRGGTQDQRRLLVLLGGILMQPGEPSQGLEGFAQAHVVRQNASQTKPGEVGQEVEPILLIGSQIGANARRQLGLGHALEVGQLGPQFGDHLVGTERIQGGFIQLGGVDQGRLLGVGRKTVEPQRGCRFVGFAVGIDVQLHPTAIGQLDEA